MRSGRASIPWMLIAVLSASSLPGLVGAETTVPPSKKEQAAKELERAQGAASGAGNLGKALGKTGKGTEGMPGLRAGIGSAISTTAGMTGAGVSLTSSWLSLEECRRNPEGPGCAKILEHGAEALRQSAETLGEVHPEAGPGKLLQRVGAAAGVASESTRAAQHLTHATKLWREGDVAGMFGESLQTGYHGANALAYAGAASGHPVAAPVGEAWLTGVAVGETADWLSKELTGRVVLENAAELAARIDREQIPGTAEWGAKLDRDASDLWYERYQAPRDAERRRQSFESLRSSNEYAFELEAQRRAAAEAAARQSQEQFASPAAGNGFWGQFLGTALGAYLNPTGPPPLPTDGPCAYGLTQACLEHSLGPRPSPLPPSPDPETPTPAPPRSACPSPACCGCGGGGPACLEC